MANLTSLRPMLEADDVKATVQWWVDSLGFTCNASMGDDPDNPGWASLSRDGIGIMFNARHFHEDDEGEPVHDHEHPERPTMTGSIYFNVDDVDGFAASLNGKVDLVFGPETMEHGMREIGLSDPNGYFLIFGTPVEG